MAEFDIAIDQREQCMIAPDANVHARLDLRAALAHNNAARRDELAIKALDTEHLRFAIPTIAGATHSFFMCHGLVIPPSSLRSLPPWPCGGDGSSSPVRPW